MARATAVGRARLLGMHPVDDGPHGEPEGWVDRCHPLGIARGEEVIDGGNVNRDPGECRRAGWQRCRQGLPFASFHLRDHSLA